MHNGAATFLSYIKDFVNEYREQKRVVTKQFPRIQIIFS